MLQWKLKLYNTHSKQIRLLPWTMEKLKYYRLKCCIWQITLTKLHGYWTFGIVLFIRPFLTYAAICERHPEPLFLNWLISAFQLHLCIYSFKDLFIVITWICNFLWYFFGSWKIKLNIIFFMSVMKNQQNKHYSFVYHIMLGE